MIAPCVWFVEHTLCLDQEYSCLFQPSTLCIFKRGEFLAGVLRMPSKKILCPRQKFRKKTHVLPPKIPKHYAPARSSNEFSELLAGSHVFFSEFLAGAKCFFGCHSQGSRQKVLFLRHSGPITGLDNQTQPRRPITGLEKCLERERKRERERERDRERERERIDIKKALYFVERL